MPDTGTISAPQLARLTGLTERHLRELASEGWIPKAADVRTVPSQVVNRCEDCRRARGRLDTPARGRSRSSVFDRVGSSPDGSMAGSAESADHD